MKQENQKKIALIRLLVNALVVSALALICFLNPAFATDLSFTVREKGTGDAIEGATVVLGQFESFEQTGEYDITDSKGFILFEDVEPFSKIKILSPGYETLEKTFTPKQSNNTNTPNQSLTFYLYPITIEGDTLEVVEDRIPEKISKITLVKEELRRVPGTAGDPLKILDSLPGVVSGSVGGGPGAIYVRGSGANDNGVLINRIPVKYLFHFGDLSGIAPSTVNPSLVKDFNVFLGGFPVNYEDKLGGILDVQLRNPKKDRIHQTYRMAINESAFLVEGPVDSSLEEDNDSFYVAGRASYLDKVLTPEIINKLIQSQTAEEDKDNFTILTLPKYYDAQANWHRELQRGYFDVSFFAAGDALAFNLNSTKETDPELLGDLTLDYDYQSFGANWLHRANNAFTYLNTLSVNTFSEQQQVGTDKDTLKPFFVSANTTTYEYDPELQWRKNSFNEINIGANISYIRSLVDLYVPARSREDNSVRTLSGAPKYRVNGTVNAALASPYIKHKRQITPKLKSTLGLRYSKVRATDGVSMDGFSPRGGIEYQLNDSLILMTSWGKYLQRPEGSTILTNFGNPNLVFMKAEHRIAGLEFKAAPLWTLKLETYYKIMEKLVLIIPDNLPPDNFQNIGKGTAYGVDFLLKREFSNRTMGWLSYSYARSTRTTITGENRRFTGDRPHALNLVWSQPFAGGWKRWTWGVKMSMRSGGLHTPTIGRVGICTDNGNYVGCANQSDPESEANFAYWEAVKAKQNSQRLPFFYLMSARVDREIRYNTWKMNIFMDVQNLSFRKNIIGYNYGKKYEKIDNPQEVAAFFFPLPILGIEAEF